MSVDLISLIKSIGYLGIFGMVFAESGLLIGFFFPGDSLLFTAGFLASQEFLNIYLLVVLSFVGAVMGDSAGYAFGHRVGRKLFRREDSFFFHKENLIKAKNFYEKHGGKTIVLARFLPMVRTFAPIVAGVGEMSYPTFLFFNVLGGAFWAVGLPLAGYFLGSFIPNVDRYLLPIVVLIIFLSVLPSFTHVLKDKNSREKIIASVKRFRARRRN